MKTIRVETALALVAMLGAGCRDSESESGSKLIPVLTASGRLTYRFQSSNAKTTASSRKSTSGLLAPLQVNQGRIHLDEEVNDQEPRQIADDLARQRWQERQDEEAYQEERRMLLAAQADERRRRTEEFEERQRLWTEQWNQRAQAEVNRVQQSSQRLDQQLQRLRGEPYNTMLLQNSASSLDVQLQRMRDEQSGHRPLNSP